MKILMHWQMLGSTRDAIKMSSAVSICATVMLTLLVTVLFMKMLVAKDRYPIAILKSMGCTGADIRRQYLTFQQIRWESL
ncbi:hypothetical protein [Paenibacillus camerounensis]|uniref:hypothetical protein n=1 Tax=Paenibacillus camerounensis TaxID=1243663 RepID=UPI0005A68412|nr:hypothetical protein [Paenibacillus camerounensis]